MLCFLFQVALLVNGSSEMVKSYRYPSIPVRKHETVSVIIGQRLIEKHESSRKHHLRPYCKLGNIAAFIGEVWLWSSVTEIEKSVTSITS